MATKSDKNNTPQNPTTPPPLKINFLKKHGIPNKPSCLAYDAIQGLLAIGGREGDIRILGKAGVEASLHQPGSRPVTQVLFAINEGILFTISEEDNSITKWDLKTSPATIISTFELKTIDISIVSGYNRQDRITTCYLPVGSTWFYLGSESGNIYVLNKDSMTLSEACITYEKLGTNVRGTWEPPSEIMCIRECPIDACLILIIVSSGYGVLWNWKTGECEGHFFPPDIDVIFTNACWQFTGKLFAIAQTDGSISLWTKDNLSKPSKVYLPKDLFGPGQTNASVIEMHWLACPQHKDGIILFSGGTITSESTIAIFYANSSKIQISTLIAPRSITTFLPLSFHPHCDKAQYLHGLVFLCPDEIFVYEMDAELSWKEVPIPTASNLANSPVYYIDYVDNCSKDFILQLKTIGEQHCYSNINERYLWPLNGGTRPVNSTSQLITTGHVNGDIRFWEINEHSMQLLYCISMQDYFIEPQEQSESKEIPQRPESPFQRSPVSPTKSLNVAQGFKSLTLPILKKSTSYSGTNKIDAERSTNANFSVKDGNNFVLVDNKIQKKTLSAISYIKTCPTSHLLCVANQLDYIIIFQFNMDPSKRNEFKTIDLGERNPNNSKLAFNQHFKINPGFIPKIVVQCHDAINAILFATENKYLAVQFQKETNFISLEKPCIYDSIKLESIISTKMKFFEERNKKKGFLKKISELHEQLSSVVESMNNDWIVALTITKSCISNCFHMFIGTHHGQLCKIPVEEKPDSTLGPTLNSPDSIAFDLWNALKKGGSGEVLNIYSLDIPIGQQSLEAAPVYHEFVAVVCQKHIRLSKVANLDRKKWKNQHVVLELKEGVEIVNSFQLQLDNNSKDKRYTSHYLGYVTNQGDITIVSLPDLTIITHFDRSLQPWVGLSLFTINLNGTGVFLPAPSVIQRVKISPDVLEEFPNLYNQRIMPEIHNKTNLFSREDSLTPTRNDCDEIFLYESWGFRNNKKRDSNKPALITDDEINNGSEATSGYDKTKRALAERKQNLAQVENSVFNMATAAQEYYKNMEAYSKK